MQKWAVAHNVDPTRILVEDRSRIRSRISGFQRISEDAAARYPGETAGSGAGRRLNQGCRGDQQMPFAAPGPSGEDEHPDHWLGCVPSCISP